MSKRGCRPQRTCLGCGARDDQDNLLRVVVEDGGLRVAKDGQGRGGYLHRARKCADAFVRRKSCYRAFHLEISKDAKERFIQESQTHWE